jgi:hypothetical protein
MFHGTLKMEAVGPSDMLVVTYKSTRWHNPEGFSVCLHRFLYSSVGNLEQLSPVVDHLPLVHSVGARSECNLKISKVGNGVCYVPFTYLRRNISIFFNLDSTQMWKNPVPTGLEAGWFPVPVWMLWGLENFHTDKESNPYSPAMQFVPQSFYLRRCLP